MQHQCTTVQGIHQTVTPWLNEKMDIADVRRSVLKALIANRFGNVARQFAIAAGKAEGQINDMLSDPPRKSFGEKVARNIEKKLGLQIGYFDNIDNGAPSNV